MQHMTVNGKTDVWPSWYNKTKSSGITNETMTFDSISKKKATDCTPAETRIDVTVSKIIDPMTKKETFYAGGYDTENEDDVHSCSDAKPKVNSINVKQEGAVWKITANISNGRYYLQSYTISVNGSAAKSGEISSSGEVSYETSEEPTNVSVRVTDTAGYSATSSWSKK